jgi:Zn-dependent metalloprotease
LIRRTAVALGLLSFFSYSTSFAASIQIKTLDKAPNGRMTVLRFAADPRQAPVAPADFADAVLSEHSVKQALKIESPSTQLKLLPAQGASGVVRYRQVVNGIPILGNDVIVRYAAAGADPGVVSHYDPAFPPAAQPKLRAADVLANVAGMSKQPLARISTSRPNAPATLPVKPISEPLLQWVPAEFLGLASSDRYVLAYQLDCKVTLLAGDTQSMRFWFDAQNGSILKQYRLQMDAKQRLTYDMGQGTDTAAAVLKKNEAGNVAPYIGTDTVVENAHRFAGSTYDYFFQNFGRDSYDGLGTAIPSYVHVDKKYNNAFWDPSSKAMYYGDGDGNLLLPLSNAITVVAHEIAHAVTDRTAALEYIGPSGAVNEAISDIFGKFVETRDNGGVVKNWFIGKEVTGPGYPRVAMRDMSSPKFGDTFDPEYPFEKNNQPDHMDLFTFTTYDNGGVHINSGIVNKFVQLLVVGGSHNGYSITGLGVATMQRLVYHALINYLTPTSDLHEFSDAIAFSCIDIGATLNGQQCLVSRFNAMEALGLNSFDKRMDAQIGSVKAVLANGNALMESGERFQVTILAHNKGGTVTNVSASLTSNNPKITVVSNPPSLPQIHSYEPIYPLQAVLKVNATLAANESVGLTLNLSGSGGNFSQSIPLTFEHFGFFDSGEQNYDPRFPIKEFPVEKWVRNERGA